MKNKEWLLNNIVSFNSHGKKSHELIVLNRIIRATCFADFYICFEVVIRGDNNTYHNMTYLYSIRDFSEVAPENSQITRSILDSKYKTKNVHNE